MFPKLTVFAAALIATYMLAPASLHGQLPTPPAPDQAQMGSMMRMMDSMRANDTKVNDLVARMNTATGTAKMDAMAELLTVLVDERKMHEPMMQNMMGMMGMMNRMNGSGRGGMMTMPTEPKK